MKLFDDLIGRVEEILKDIPFRRYPYSPEPKWRDEGENFVLLGRECAFELGAEGSGCCACLVTEKRFFEESETRVYGKELNEIEKNTPYARIAVVYAEGGEESEDLIYGRVKSIDFVKYRVFPEGYMLRVSAEGNKEAVRVGKSALKKGISFAEVGGLYLKKYLAEKGVKAVRLIFVTRPEAVEELEKVAREAKLRTRALNKILKSGMLDCSVCALKPVCDEVDELKALHFGRANAEGDKK